MVKASDPQNLHTLTGLASLQEICRSLIIRELPLTEINAFVAVERLPLPTALKKYLVFDVNPNIRIEF
jgi:hypothetical protein